MIFRTPKDIKFSYLYKKMNILSVILIIFSIVVLLYKGLNLGVDFKGGTLIEIRTENNKTDISDIRYSLLKMNLGDVTVKKFGKENDYLVKIEMTKTDNENFILMNLHTDFSENCVLDTLTRMTTDIPCDD